MVWVKQASGHWQLSNKKCDVCLHQRHLAVLLPVACSHWPKHSPIAWDIHVLTDRCSHRGRVACPSSAHRDPPPSLSPLHLNASSCKAPSLSTLYPSHRHRRRCACFVFSPPTQGWNLAFVAGLFNSTATTVRCGTSSQRLDGAVSHCACAVTVLLRTLAFLPANVARLLILTQDPGSNA